MPEQNEKGSSDDVRQADESGEPGRSGRSHGRVVDKNNPEGTNRPGSDDRAKSDDPNKATEKSEHWESGCQQSN